MLARRLTAQLLSGKQPNDPVAVAERLLAIQGQDPRAARLAIRARTKGVVSADIDRALTEDRSLLITWLNRGTLHMIRSADYHWLHALTTPQLFTGNSRRLAQEGVTPSQLKRGLDIIERALTADGPLTRGRLRALIAKRGVRVEGQALVHILMAASLRGMIVRGPMIGTDHAYALVSEWLQSRPAVDLETALGELARRYLAGHGPADERDLAKWAGIPLRDARAGFRSIAAQLTEVADGSFDLGRRSAAPLPAPRLLGGYEPVLLGWKSRDDIVGDPPNLITNNGLLRPFALVDGKAVATWTIKGGLLVLDAFAPISKRSIRALEADASDIARFFGEAEPLVAVPSA